MGFLNKLMGKADTKKPALSEDELIKKLKYCKEHDLPVHHKIHGNLKVTRIEDERFFADSDTRKDLMFPYKYFSDGLLTLPEDKSSGGAW